MKVFVLALTMMGCVLVPPHVKAQAAEIERAETALAAGDAGVLTALCADRVDVTLGGASTTYSRAQVRYVLDGFFDATPPLAFAFEHRMASGDAELVSGRYVADGRTYQVMVRFGRRGAVWEVRELRVDG